MTREEWESKQKKSTVKNYKGEIMGAVARGFCHKETEHLVMDSDLAMAIVEEVIPVFREIAKEAGTDLINRPDSDFQESNSNPHIAYELGRKDGAVEILSNIEKVIT